MMEINNFIKALKGAESLILILPSDVSNILDIKNQDWLKFEIKNGQLVIKKLEVGGNSINTDDMDNLSLQSHNYEKNISANSVSEDSVNIP